MSWFNKKSEMPAREDALPGRSDPIVIAEQHFVNGRSIQEPFPDDFDKAIFGVGCFWGAERRFWQTEGVYTTAVGYAGGFTQNPTYQEVCGGMTGHNEVVLVVYDPGLVSYDDLLKVFWELHNPTQGMRQGNDIGTQYRSGIYAVDDVQIEAAKASKSSFQAALSSAGYGTITTEIIDAPVFYYAEEPHQQYLAKVPGGYCGLGGTGVTCPVGLLQSA
jgi:peptide-methionine (S)-S-oxide reductase